MKKCKHGIDMNCMGGGAVYVYCDKAPERPRCCLHPYQFMCGAFVPVPTKPERVPITEADIDAGVIVEYGGHKAVVVSDTETDCYSIMKHGSTYLTGTERRITDYLNMHNAVLRPDLELVIREKEGKK